MTQKTCKHEFLKKIGSWDGINEKTKERTGGYKVKCKECNEELYLSNDEWNKISAKNRE